MTTTLESQVFVQKLLVLAFVGKILFLLFKILPFVAMWSAFTFLYIFMPNTRVQFRAALLGGIFGGTLWQVAQWGYVTFQVGVARYNAIYGTMAAVPIFMVWIYFSWVIVLLGLEVTYANQNLRTVRREIRSGDVNFISREQVALTIMLVIGEAFNRGGNRRNRKKSPNSWNFRRAWPRAYWPPWYGWGSSPRYNTARPRTSPTSPPALWKTSRCSG